MFRAIALSLFLFIGLGVVVPFVTDYAEAGAHKTGKDKKKYRKYKKYSKKWWRAYYRRQKRNKALAAQRRHLRLRQIRLAKAKNAASNGEKNSVSMVKVNQKSVPENAMPAILPSGEAAPKGWTRGAVSANELQYRVDDDNGSQLGSASLSVVGPAVGADNGNLRVKTVGGVPTGSLRRTVIDRMIREEGWVVNDYQKEIGGRRVFVVVAQSPGASGKVQSRLFYFTEADGRIYSLSTNSPSDNSRRIEQESERVITSLQNLPRGVQQAELK
ncbi:MAG TPA: hypothetical protein VNI84_02475 [Pyrinomonadaceae bacterium]|nr:hypothetical protein [Pyrinomonadaceae bacterium]